MYACMSVCLSICISVWVFGRELVCLSVSVCACGCVCACLYVFLVSLTIKYNAVLLLPDVITIIVHLSSLLLMSCCPLNSPPKANCPPNINTTTSIIPGTFDLRVNRIAVLSELHRPKAHPRWLGRLSHADEAVTTSMGSRVPFTWQLLNTVKASRRDIRRCYITCPRVVYVLSVSQVTH